MLSLMLSLLAFAFDPDGYSVEIIKRGGIDFGDTKVIK